MKKCCIISQQGSGTNLLRSFLNSHPDIYIADEIFFNSEKFRAYKEEFDEEALDRYLNEFFSTGKSFDKNCDVMNLQETKIPKVLGFDLKYNNIESCPEILNWLIKEDVKIIHLYRCKGRTFLRNMNEINKATLTYDQFRNHVNRVTDWQTNIKHTFDKGDWKTYQELTYEELTGGREISLIPDFELESCLQIFLEVDYEKLYINKEGIREGKLIMRY